MPVNPNIALGVQPVQIADPMAQYGKMIAIQNAQNQNALNQYQLGAAQRGEAREVAKMNALAQAGTDEAAVANALLKSGDLAGYSAFVKAAEDRKTQKLTQQKTEAELFDASMKQIRNFWGNVRTPEEALAIHDATHKDPIINKRLQALGITEQMGRQQIIDAAKNPASFATFVKRAQLGAEKFMEMNKPQLSTKDVGATLEDRTFEPLTGKITTVSTTPKTKTFADTVAERQANIAAGRLGIERDRLAQEATGVVYQEDANGNVIALPSKLKKGEVPVARVAVAPGGGFQALQGKPSEAVGKELMSINQQRAIINGAMEAAKETPNAFGWTEGNMPESLRGRWANSKENENRAFVYNVVSGVIKERAGTAQTAGEKATLDRFLPSEGDTSQIIQDKLTGFLKYLDARETGTSKKRSGGGTPPKPAAGGGGVDTNNPLLK